MKRIILVLALCLPSLMMQAQLKIDNAVFFIGAGSTVTVQGDVTSNVDILGTGLLQLKGTALQNVNMGGNTIPNLELDNTADATLLSSNARIGNSLLFTNGKFLLANLNLLMAPAASVSGHNASRFVVTGGTGVLTKQALTTTPFTYPVGFSATEYNPVAITNNGTADDISVRCLQNVLDNGLTGSPVTGDFANNSWVVTEGIAGGSDLNMTGEWITADELPGFNRLRSGIARYASGTDWDLPAGNVQAAAGAGPYTRNRAAINQPGVFAIADLDKVNAAKLNLKIFLQGPYNTGLGIMNDGLRTSNVIPLAQPYSAALNSFFNRAGSIYDGSPSVNETVPAATVFDVAGTNDDIVDWVFISMQDGNTPATRLQTRAALVQRDGDIVEYDAGTATYVPVRMPLDANGNYHLVVGHRNHLPIRTPVSQLLQDNTVFNYDFTTALSQAYQNPANLVNTAMKDLTGGKFGLWGGNANSNNSVRANGGANPLINDYAFLINSVLGGSATAIINNVYNAADLNMNGTVRANGGANPLINDYAFLINSVLGGSATLIINQHQ